MENTESNSSAEKKERRFSEYQYDMLRRCSKNKDMTEWNEWRSEGEDVLLEYADLKYFYLKNAKLASYSHPKSEAYLNGTDFFNADLEGCILSGAHLNKANFEHAFLYKAVLMESHIEGARFVSTNLQSARFDSAIVDGETHLYKN